MQKMQAEETASKSVEVYEHVEKGVLSDLVGLSAMVPVQSASLVREQACPVRMSG
jgi:hypothetical protein